MNEAINELDPYMKKKFEENIDLVVDNYRYMISIGITDPSTLMPYAPHIFLISTKYLAKDLKNGNIDLINEDPSSIFDIFQE